jgi:hypothetical protein
LTLLHDLLTVQEVARQFKFNSLRRAGRTWKAYGSIENTRRSFKRAQKPDCERELKRGPEESQGFTRGVAAL